MTRNHNEDRIRANSRNVEYILNIGTSTKRYVSIRTRNHNEDRIRANSRNVECIK
jgi:hypothetical protein